MKKFANHLLLLLVCIFCMTACRDLKEVQCTGVKGFKVNQVNMEGIDADIMLGIKNPNNMGFSIYKSTFDVTYAGVYLGKAKMSKRVHINANTEAIYSFNLKSDFKGANLPDIMKLVSGAIGRGMVEVKGDLKAGKFLLRKKFPVNVKERVGLN
ncbi:MAG: LEA type 2 family protein [Bacteroidota bacterium]